MDEANFVIGVSATLGQAQSKNFILSNFEESQIIDLKIIDNNLPSIELDVIAN